MQNILTPKFFERPVITVAPQLLGNYLVREQSKQRTAYRITEVEAYDGEDDAACHAHKGRTPRTEVMFGPAGVWYVYLIYGMYEMLNIVTGPSGYPAGVLIRAVEGIEGPGRLTRALGIGRDLKGKPAAIETGLWIESGEGVMGDEHIVRTPRIGVAYAGACADWPYRFVLEKKRPSA